MQNKYEHILLPVVALRGIVIFPGMTLHFDVSRKNAISALKNALAENKPVFLTCQKDPTEEDPAFPGLYAFGVAAEVRQVIRIQGSNNVRAVVEGRFRAAMRETASARPFMSAFIERCEEKPVKPSEAGYEKALIRESLALFEEYHSVSPRMASSEIKFTAAGVSAAGALSDSVSSVIPLPPDTKQKLLAELNPLKRLEKLSVILSEEIEIMLIEGDIRRKVQEQMEKNQKEYYLREQMKIISEEMGEDDYYDDEIDEYERKIKKSKMPDSNKEKLFEEVKKLEKIHPHSPENGGILTYLDTCLSLPWGKYTKDRLNLQNAKKTLERDHYGLEDVKERIIEMLAARAIAPGIKGQIICLAGPPGVGKTSVARSVAKAMGRKYERISLGGVRDEAEIRGHRRTYLGAIPGRIIHAVKSAKTANPLILLDEVDKLCGDFRGDPAAALLEALDGEQNVSFCDHYLEIPFDLSKVLFITTANDKYSIPAPLLDRMEVIELYSYTAEEKFNIAKKHLMPKQLKEHGLTKKNIKIADDAV
ncbi:MAG: LON peptidase substrate-binding domain-containing protein, partial [Oscillospiraceae bacterium]|nr:LON peptidase substrate-binding domain-containing protein [Oscillospiraceae bacterium]